MCVAMFSTSLLSAQVPATGSIQKNGVPAVVPKPRPGGSLGTGKPGSGGNSLSSNFVLTVTVKEAERQLGEVSVLTSSSTVKTEVNLDTSSTPQTLSFAGMLQELEGGLFIWDYELGFRIPITTGTAVAAGSQLRTTTVEYQSFTSQGRVLMTIGRSYELLKAGGRVYSVSILPAAEG